MSVRRWMVTGVLFVVPLVVLWQGVYGFKVAVHEEGWKGRGVVEEKYVLKRTEWVTLGPRTQPPETAAPRAGCVEEIGKWYEGELFHEEKAKDSTYCADVCMSEPDCGFYNFRKFDSVCHLFRKGYAAERVSHPEPNHNTGVCIHGPPAPTPPLHPLPITRQYKKCNIKIGMKPTASGMTATFAYSTYDCVRQCLAEKRCVMASHMYNDNTCTLHAEPTGTVEDKMVDFIDCSSAEKVPNPPPTPPALVKDLEYPPLSTPFLCNASDAEYTAWRKRVGQIPCEYSNAASFKPVLPETRGARWYCDKLGNTLEPYPLRERNDTLVVGLYSGEGILYTRGAVCEDTWLSDVPARYLYTSTDEEAAYHVKNATLSVVPLSSHSHHLRPRSEHTNAHMLQLIGLRDMYLKNPTADWYVIVGDDTYIDTDFLLKGLEKYDPDEPLWLSHAAYREEYGKSTAWQWIKKTSSREDFLRIFKENWTERHGATQFEWTSGATAWVLSRPAAKLYADNLPAIMGHMDLQTICYCPDLVTGMILSVLGLRITTFTHMVMHPYAVDSVGVDMRGVPEVTLYHYVQPARMISLHQRAQHAKLDRLIAHQSAALIHAFYRSLYQAHLSAHSRRAAQCTNFNVPPPAPLPTLDTSAPHTKFINSLRAFIDAHHECLREWQATVFRAALPHRPGLNHYDLPV